MGAGVFEGFNGVAWKAVFAPAVGSDERAVHDQVGVAADGGGEMRVRFERETEVAEVLGRVVGLGHGPERRHVDLLGMVRVGSSVQEIVQVRGFEDLAFGQSQTCGFRCFAQGGEFVRVGFFVDPEQERLFLLDKGFGGCNVGEDHEFLDQFVSVETIFEGHRGDVASVVQNDPAFGQVEVEGLARGAGFQKGVIGRVERL